jgi:aminoglycoside phosphotransferase (APT) family kinase protein
VCRDETMHASRRKNKTYILTIECRHELNAQSLESYLIKSIPGFMGPMEISQFNHGQSNPTYLLKDAK